MTLEDPCHFVEHAIEFQVVFLQYLFGPAVRILPVLCGAFADGPRTGRRPEANDQVARFAGALGELAAREGPAVVRAGRRLRARRTALW